jgi:hypothetical protein
MKMGSIVCTETSVRNYHYSLRNTPEEHRPHPFRGGSLKSRIVNLRICSNFKVPNLAASISLATDINLEARVIEGFSYIKNMKAIVLTQTSKL